MKIIIYFCVAILPSLIHCSSKCDSNGTKIEPLEYEKLKKNLDEMAERNGIINDIYMPAKNGFLGMGSYAVMNKGTLHYPNTETVKVAMKFTHINEKQYAEKEYEIYSYLKAIDNPQVELYGIPSVYYYGSWDDYIIMAITLLDAGFKNSYKAGELTETDLLVVCKEFIRASKYMHSCGIVHEDIRFANMMFRGNNGFIIDYNMAEKMYETGTLNTSSRKIGMKHAKNDWKRFLFAIADFCDVDLHLSFNISEPETENEIKDIMNKLERTDYFEEIKRVSVEMALHIFGLVDPSRKNDKTSVYDRVYGIINEEIEMFGEGPQIPVHWLSQTERNLICPEPSISTIDDPFKLVEINYPEVKWDYFQKKILQLKSSGSSSRSARKTFSSIGSSKFNSNEKKKRF